MIKLVIFDNHGVLCFGDKEGGIEKLEQLLEMPQEEFIDCYWACEEKTFKGGMTPLEQFSLFVKKIGTNIMPDKIMEVAYSHYKVREGMMNLVADCAENYEIAILTNFNSDFWLLNKGWDYEKVFKKENIFISSEIGYRKPEKQAYREVLNKFDCKPEEAIFIDDSDKNVEAAQKLGINGILFKNKEQLEKDLEKYGKK